MYSSKYDLKTLRYKLILFCEYFMKWIGWIKQLSGILSQGNKIEPKEKRNIGHYTCI